MAYNNTTTEAMISSQFDAFKNMYDIELKWPSHIDTTKTEEVISVRAKGIKIPDFEIATYERHYHGSKINIPKPEQTFDRQVEVTFTMDSAFQYYQTFCQWASLCGDPVNGGVSNSIPTAILGRLTVAPLTGNYFANGGTNSAEKGGDVGNQDKTKYTESETGAAIIPKYSLGKTGALAGLFNTASMYWTFGKCWVSKVTAPEFAVDSSEPLEFTVTFQFLDFDAPGYGGFRTTQSSTGEYAPAVLGNNA